MHTRVQCIVLVNTGTTVGLDGPLDVGQAEGARQWTVWINDDCQRRHDA